MELLKDDEGQPICPECGDILDYESTGNRDQETTMGSSIEYFYCNKGCGSFEVIEDEIFPT